MSKPAKMLTAALYARFSSDLQKDRSIDDQFRDLERAAKRFGFMLDKKLYFSDRAQTATSLFDRPGLTRELLGASAKHAFDVVLVEATDRLSRSQADLFWLSDRFKFDNVKIFTPSGEVSEMQLTFDSHSNADMVKKLAIRVKRGHDGIAREGKVAGSLSYGYDAVPGKPGERTINAKEAAVIRRIFTEYASGKTPRQIVDGLAKDNISSPSGAPFWNHQVIVGGVNKRGLIHNRLYIGEYVKNRFYNVKAPETGGCGAKSGTAAARPTQCPDRALRRGDRRQRGAGQGADGHHQGQGDRARRTAGTHSPARSRDQRHRPASERLVDVRQERRNAPRQAQEKPEGPGMPLGLRQRDRRRCGAPDRKGCSL
jgi:DNA invertase Pin-like site-specific DNA recombinase